ncbi:glycosyl hydrolase family 67 [bacterium]|nr:glycosyl hydrolase family 67 [bacterium]
MKLFIIDAIGPFFVGYNKRVVNWSKIPFRNLECGNHLDPIKIKMVKEAYSKFLIRISALGFNAISIDDVAHLVEFDFYPESLKIKLREYKQLYKTIFDLTVQKGIKIFVNTDIMFFNPFIEGIVGTSIAKNTELLQEALIRVFTDFPIDGIIFRIGECDGSDVVGDFNSRLIVKTPKTANRFIKTLLPVFEEFNQHFIFRTWTIGSYPIGDLIWNPKTFKAAFAGINSPHFIVSMKYGDTDFFSNLELNPLFYSSNFQTILELQTRRERECFGALPYYVGWDYEKYYKKLQLTKKLVGISVWCQTGGWSRNKELTFIDDTSVWNELNTVASIKIFKEGWSANQAVEGFFSDKETLLFLEGFHNLLFKILYPKDFADKTLYFRRTRIPPLMWLSWDYVSVNPLIKALYRFSSILGRSTDVNENDIERIRQIGLELKIGRINFYCDTLRMLLYCSLTVSGAFSESNLMDLIDQYTARFPGNNLKFKITPERRTIINLGWLMPLLIRKNSSYRLFDKIMLNGGLSRIQLSLMLGFSKDHLPKFANKRAMRPEVLFK